MLSTKPLKRQVWDFFTFVPLGAFQGKLNPIWSKVIYETCVVSILLYGCENWILTNSIIDQIVAFQADGKKNLEVVYVPFCSVHPSRTKMAFCISNDSYSKVKSTCQSIMRMQSDVAFTIILQQRTTNISELYKNVSLLKEN